MSDQPKRKPGRPKGTTRGQKSFHLGLRFDDSDRDKLLAVVDNANRLSVESGLPPIFTPSALATLWIRQRLDQEFKKVRRS